jgi:receptor protein-tyrosine kinase
MTNISPYQSNSESGLDLADLFVFLWQKKFRIIFMSAILISLGSYYVLQQPKVYRATSILLIGEESQSIALSSMAALSGNSTSKMDTHIEFIKSRQFIRSVVETLALHHQDVFIPVKKQQQALPDIDHTVDMILNDLTLSSVKNTEMLKVTFASVSPDIAVELVNQIGPSFFEFRSIRSRDKAANASRWLNTQIEDIRASLTAAEEKLEDFLQKNELVDVTSQIRLVQGEISTLMREKLITDKAYAELTSTYQQVIDYETDTRKLLGVPWILNNALVAELRQRTSELEQAFNEVSQRYKFKHRKYISAKTSLDNIRLEMDQLLVQLATSLTREFETLGERQEQLAAQINQAKSQHNKFGRLEIELTRLRREVESNQKLYEAFLARLQEMEVLKDFSNQDNYAVVDYATRPNEPFKPRVTLSIALITIMASVFSYGFWLLLHLISDRPTRFRQMMRKMNVPILAEIVKLPKSRIKGTVAAVVQEGQKNYQYAEAIRSLRTSVMMQSGDTEHRVIAVTGVTKGDGKTSIAISLAHSFGKLEQTLLVDTDLRSPSIAQAYGLDPKHPGITNFVRKSAKFRDCLHKDSRSQLSIMPSGPVPADPMVYISKPRFAEIIRKLGIFYERVVVEAPPVNNFSDALILSKYVDGIIIVCDADNTETAELVEAVQRLQDSGAPFLGIVLNKVKNVRNKLPQNSKTKRLLKKALGW